LPCDLNEVERDERARAGMGTVRQLVLMKEEHSVKHAEMKAGEKELEKRIKALAVAAETGREERVVECYESPNLATFRVEFIRMDTGESFDTREMDEDERKKAKQRSFEYSPEIVSAAEAERRVQANRKKVTELKNWERRRDVNRMDAEREHGIERAAAPPPAETPADFEGPGVLAGALLDAEPPPARHPTDPAPPPFHRDPTAKPGSMANPRDLPDPVRFDDDAPPERPGADLTDDELEVEKRTEEARLGSADNPRPIGPPPQGERH
jgi:hypothetical protein